MMEPKLLTDYQENFVKCNKKADEFRNLGNQLYKSRKFEEALVNYNKSLCYSPEDSSNIGIAFANRSAVYYEIGQYEKCLENIELAKNHNYLKKNIIKLNKRKEQALEKLNNSPDPNQNSIKYKAARERFLKPKLKAKENLNFFVADCLELKTNSEYGRHLITNEDLKPGSVIAIEKPFTKIIAWEATYERCVNCLKNNLFNLLPCFKCCSAMFCSEECQTAAQEKFHKFECGLMNVTCKFAIPLHNAPRFYFEALHILKTPSELKNFLKSIKNKNVTILDFDYKDEESFRKNSLHAIDSLVTFEKSPYCIHSMLRAIKNASEDMCDFMLNHSNALKAVLTDVADQLVFREFVFKYSQIASLNVHELCYAEVNSDQNHVFGSACYLFTSLINHSCAPNVTRISSGSTNYIVVERPIKKGGQIFDNYGMHHCRQPFTERQKYILEEYFFECRCEACQDNYPLYPNLDIKDIELFDSLIKDKGKLLSRNLDLAVANFEKYCKLSDELNEKYYPSYEMCLLIDWIYTVTPIRSDDLFRTYRICIYRNEQNNAETSIAQISVFEKCSNPYSEYISGLMDF